MSMSGRKREYIILALAGIAVVLVMMLSPKRGEAHDCYGYGGGSGGWQDGYIESEPYCWQEAIADANGGITYVTVCN